MQPQSTVVSSSVSRHITENSHGGSVPISHRKSQRLSRNVDESGVFTPQTTSLLFLGNSLYCNHLLALSLSFLGKSLPVSRSDAWKPPPAVIMSNVLLVYCDCFIVVSVMDSCEWATQLGCKVIQYRDGNNKKRVMVMICWIQIYDLVLPETIWLKIEAFSI